MRSDLTGHGERPEYQIMDWPWMEQLLDMARPWAHLWAGRFFPWSMVLGYALIPALLGILMIRTETENCLRVESLETPVASWWLSPVTILYVSWSGLVGTALMWWIARFGGLTGWPLVIPTLVGIVLVPLIQIVQVREVQSLTRTIRLGREEARHYKPDAAERRMSWLLSVFVAAAPVAALVVGQYGVPLFVAYGYGSLAVILTAIILALFQTGGRTRLVQSSNKPDAPPDWLRLTPLESDIGKLVELSGRRPPDSIACRISLQDPLPVGTSVTPSEELEQWRRWLSSNFTSHGLATFPAGRPQVWVPGLRILPPDSHLVLLAIRILGQRRTQWRLKVLRFPGARFLLAMNALIPDWIKSLVRSVLVVILMVGVILSGPVIGFDPIHLFSLVGLLVIVWAIFQLICQSSNSRGLYEGYRGWKQLNPLWAERTDREAVPEFLKWLAILEAVSLNYRKPEFMAPILLGQTKVKKLLQLTGLKPEDIPAKSIQAAVADAIEDALDPQQARGYRPGPNSEQRPS